ncbi:MAG: nucleotidyltransferase domain-containing protein [Actinobacteria bacterium]|nr:nucleotidyltransferase domain-containing protein [Actinomycetota bacterium]
MPHKEISAQERREKLNNELNRMLPMIIEIGVEKVILIGSMATGKTHSLSDINLIIIKKTNKRFIDRLDEFYKILMPKVSIDILVYDPVEFKKMSKSNLFVRHALEKGQILYETPKS